MARYFILAGILVCLSTNSLAGQILYYFICRSQPKLPSVSCILEDRTVQSGLHRGAAGSSFVDLEQDTFILA